MSDPHVRMLRREAGEGQGGGFDGARAAPDDSLEQIRGLGTLITKPDLNFLRGELAFSVPPSRTECSGNYTLKSAVEKAVGKVRAEA